MITKTQSDRLKDNWGAPAEALACYALIRFFDPLSPWECYLLAQNPDDEDEIACLIKGFFVELSHWRLSELANRYNAAGEPIQIDNHYRPRRAAELFKQLSEVL